MKLKIKEFRTIAKRKGYGNEKILYIALGGGDYGINAIKAGCKVGYEIVREIYSNVSKTSSGAATTISFGS